MLVMKCVKGYLTQGRSDIKKKVRLYTLDFVYNVLHVFIPKILSSIAPAKDPDNKVDIAELADNLANNSITVTAQLWARVAFLVCALPMTYSLLKSMAAWGAWNRCRN